MNVHIKRNKSQLNYIENNLSDKQTSKSIKNKKGQLYADNLRIYNNSIVFDIDSYYLQNANNVQFYLKKRKDTMKIELDIKRKMLGFEKEKVIIPISQFYQKKSLAGQWDLSVVFQHRDFKEEQRIGHYNTNHSLEMKKQIGFAPLNDELGVSPYLTMDNGISIYFCTMEQYIHSKYLIESSIKNLTLNKAGILSFTALISVLETDNFKVNSIILRLRQKKNHFIKIPFTEIFANGHSREIMTQINLNENDFEQFYWDFFIDIDLENNKNHLVRIKNDNPLIRQKIKHRVFKYTNKKKDGYVVYPYLTEYDCLSLTYRKQSEFESKKYKFNEYTAFIIFKLFSWYFNWKPIWLIHEKYSETAQDNSYYFFKYCYDNHFDKKVYFVIKKGSPDEAVLAHYKKRVLYFMSLKHLILLLGSKLIISSETKLHGYVWRNNRGIIKDYVNRKRYVFLQHGVLGLKRVEKHFKSSTSNEAKLFVVSSNFEKKIVKDYFGYKEDNIIVTGLARWDVLEDKSSNYTRKEILLMPTWRNWLEEVENEEFLLSDYFKEYNSFLHSPQLIRMLKEKNTVLNFYVHPKFMPYLSNFKSDSRYIKIIQFGEEKINDLIMRSSLLITDYSSVSWEMYYLRKPVLFFHFDLEEYLEKQGSYIDLKNKIFGDVAYTSSDLIEKLNGYISNGFKERRKFAELRPQYFEHIDKDNNARIFNEIKKREKLLEKSDGILDSLKHNYLIAFLWRKYKKNPIIRRSYSFLEKLLK